MTFSPSKFFTHKFIFLLKNKNGQVLGIAANMLLVMSALTECLGSSPNTTPHCSSLGMHPLVGNK